MSVLLISQVAGTMIYTYLTENYAQLILTALYSGCSFQQWTLQKLQFSTEKEHQETRFKFIDHPDFHPKIRWKLATGHKPDASLSQ